MEEEARAELLAHRTNGPDWREQVKIGQIETTILFCQGSLSAIMPSHCRFSAMPVAALQSFTHAASLAIANQLSEYTFPYC